MRKQVVLGTLVSLALVLAFAASAQATYSDAISINLSVGSDSTVTGTVTGASGFAASNWMNMTGGHGANWAASVDGSGWTSGSLSGPQLTSTGASLGTGYSNPQVPGNAFRIDLYDGGWFANSQWNDSGNTANMPGRSGMSNGDMPNNWGPTGLGIQVSALPASFVSAGYDVWALMGPTQNSGAGLTWQKLNATPLTSLSSPAYAIYYPAAGAPYTASRSLAAVQVLQISTAAPSFTATPGAGALDFGNVGVSTISTQTVTLNNIGTGPGDVTSATVTGSFILSSGTAPVTVAALGSAAYDIQLPTQTVPGTYSGTASFVTATGTFDYTLTATVIAHDGDVNGDGQVSLLDYNVIKVNFGNVYESGKHWADGDVNNDLQVGLLDFNIVKAHFGHTTGDTGVTAVPEPATLSLLALAGLAALRRKR